MNRRGPSAAALLDQAADLVVRAIPEWAALLALSALPLRLLEVHFANRLLQLGAQAPHYLDHLRSISWLVTLAFAPALAGRALFARACALALQSGARVPAALVLRLPLGGWLGYSYAALVWQGLFQVLAWMVLPLPLLALGGGLALATAPLTGEEPPRPGPLASLAPALRRAPPAATCLALAATFTLALGAALANLFFLFRLGLWLAGGLGGGDLASWSLALGFGNRHFLLLLAAGAVGVVEPFWLASLVLAVRAARARESGEDLAARFAELRANALAGQRDGVTYDALPVKPRRALRMILGCALAALACAPCAAAIATAAPAASLAAPFSVAAYRQRLIALERGLQRGDWQTAKREAGSLARERVAFAGGELAPDLSVLGPLAAARDRAAAGRVAYRLAAVIAALAIEPPPAPDALAASGPPADSALLARLRREQALAAIPAGGKLPDPGVRDGGLFAAIRDFLQPLARAIASARDRFFRWLERWIQGLFARGPDLRSAFGLRGIVALAVGLALAMLVLAVLATLRRRRRLDAAADPRARPLPAPAEDDDPLSRAAAEWESYARELAAAGRLREAIRAWYHAVLVALYQSGALHFRPGRTNWEYVSTVPPGTPWRPALIEITHCFEREWYGRERSSAEALFRSQEAARRLLDALRSSPA